MAISSVGSAPKYARTCIRLVEQVIVWADNVAVPRSSGGSGGGCWPVLVVVCVAVAACFGRSPSGLQMETHCAEVQVRCPCQCVVEAQTRRL
jgi:hypothetical protein